MIFIIMYIMLLVSLWDCRAHVCGCFNRKGSSLKVLNESLTAQFAAVDFIQHVNKAALTDMFELDSRAQLIKLQLTVCQFEICIKKKNVMTNIQQC